MSDDTTTDSLLQLVESAFRPVPGDALWQQFDVALARRGGDPRPSARTLFGALLPWLEHEQAAGDLYGWFFMRKPPDVRLRLLAGHAAARLAGEAASLLRGLHAEGGIGGWRPGRYRPEQARFGGAEGMALAHACFHVDSTLWGRLDMLEAAGRRGVDGATLLPALLQHLFGCCRGSAADYWRALLGLIRDGGIDVAPQAPRRPASLPVLIARSALDPAERAALQAYRQLGTCLGSGLAPAEAGRLGRSPVQIAAAMALFQLNRHGVPGTRSGPMTAAALAACDGA